MGFRAAGDERIGTAPIHRGTAGVLGVARLGVLLDAVRFEHTLFALPFAYLGVILAARGLPTGHQFLWVTVAMVAARTLAMSANRLIDWRLDALNPRTAGRALPRGILRPIEMAALSLVSLASFLFAAAQLNPLALTLAPFVAVFIVGYSYTKRFTWLSHFALGIADGIAPMGGWIGVAGALPWEAVLLGLAVATWVGGFDMMYCCQDYDFDRRQGLKSVAQTFGIGAALRWSAAMHGLTSASLLALGIVLGLGPVYYLGWAVATVLLVYEHWLLLPEDLSRLDTAFFNVNGYLAIIIFLCTGASVLFRV